MGASSPTGYHVEEGIVRPIISSSPVDYFSSDSLLRLRRVRHALESQLFTQFSTSWLISSFQSYLISKGQPALTGSGVSSPDSADLMRSRFVPVSVEKSVHKTNKSR